MQLKVLVVLFLCSISINYSPTDAVRNFDLRWTHANCNVIDSLYFSSFNCKIHELPKNRGNYIDASLTTATDINDTMVMIRILVPSIAKPSASLELIKFKMNGCKIFDYKSKNPLLNAFLKKMWQAGNLPKKCPLKTNHVYYVKNFSLNPDFLPPYTPENNFTVQMQITTKRGKLLIFSDVGGVLQNKKPKG